MADSLVQDLLGRIELLEPNACGAYLVECNERHVGTVFVERNQVCWAAATGQGRRLRDLLREHLAGTVSNEELEQDYQRCKDEGRRIGESLVSRSLVTSDAMRAALKQHTIESLIALPDHMDERVLWIAHRHQGYLPRFTFSPLELFVATNAHMYRSEALAAEAGHAHLGLDIRSASYVVGDDDEPIAVRATGTHPNIKSVIDLGAWAHAAFGVASKGFSPVVMNHVIDTNDLRDGLSLAWRSSRRVIHAAVTDDVALLRRVIKELERRCFPTLLSKRATNPLLVQPTV